MSVEIKICGITRVEDAQAAMELGASMLGLNFYPQSPRCIPLSVRRKLRASSASQTVKPDAIPYLAWRPVR